MLNPMRVHEVFESIVAQYPEKTAVVCGGDRISYRDLNSRANQLAHHLLDLGLEREGFVALAMPKSCDLIVAMLGILKAGGAYVPLGENFPIAKLREIIHDAGCTIAVGQRGHLDELWTAHETLVLLDDASACEESNPVTHGDPRDLAYVLYTSGSTGEPKGVQVEHAGVVRLVVGQDYMPFDAETNHFFMGPISFDLSTLGIYGPVLNGSTMVIVADLIPDAAQLEELIRREDVRAGMVIFGLFASLIEARPKMFETMSTVVVGGEAVTASVMRRAMDAMPNTRFVNGYGPTEATVLSTTYQIESIGIDAPATIPIGKPLAGMTHVVVDSELMPVEQGELGELCMIGVGLARGYLNREELTREKFPTIDVGNDHRVRVYRTGDRVYELPSGDIVFDGRIDQQVKIRGFRIELGAIEAAIERLSAVHSAAVIAVGDGASAILVACVVGEYGDESSVLDALDGQLTEYMMPDRVMLMDSFEVTANGKIDKSALVERVSRELNTKQRSAYCSPHTSTEKTLCSLWEQLLGHERVGVDDSFIGLGGHSLRAVVLCSRVRDQLGVELPVSVVFSNPSVRQLGVWIDNAVSTGVAIETIEAVDRKGFLPTSYHQERLWMHDKIHPFDPSYNISMRLHFAGDLDEQAMQNAWRALHQRHEILRTRILGSEQVVLGMDEFEPAFRLEDAVGEQEMDAAQRREFSRVFDLESVPLARICVYKMRSGRAVLAITIHHIISDAWSCEILRRELEEFYAAEIQGREPILDKLSVQYADYAHWQRRRAETDEYKEKLGYWTEKLRDARSTDLPADSVRSSQIQNAGDRVQMDLPEKLVADIRRLACERSVTTNAVLLGAFNAWLHRLVGDKDVVIGMPIANREHSSLEGLIGFFMDTVPLRTPVADCDTFGDVVTHTAQELWESVDRCEVAFQHQIEAIGGHAEAGRNPVFEIFFNYIALQLRGAGGKYLSFDEQEIDNKTAKFDLTCYIFDDEKAMSVVFNYRVALFEQSTMERYLAQFVALLTAAIGRADARVSSLRILSNEEDQTWDSVRRGKQVEELPGEHILAAVDRTARRYPDAVAVASVLGELSYAEMVRWSHGACEQLRSLGVKPGDRVAIAIEDHRLMAAAVLGVLRAGAIYVPIELGWPAARIEQVLALSSAGFVISEQQSWAGAASVSPDDWSLLDGAGEDGAAICPNAPVYMIFTSGSTGVPKGVVQTHRGVVEHNTVFADSLGLRSDDRVLMLSSPAFDAAPMDMYAAWFVGAAWCPFDLQRHDDTELAEFVSTQGVSIFHSAPSVLRWFAGCEPDSGLLESVRTVVMGGEPAFGNDARWVQQTFPQCRVLINGLGMTESSVTLQHHIDLRGQRTEASSALPIGQPTKGVRVRLVDKDGAETALFGEIEIESSRIAAGYWDAERREVVAIGEATADGRVELRTGDLAVMRADGMLVHRGRVDQQVQVHGCRVEPGEAQSAVGSLDAVREAAVIAVEDEAGGHKLCAFVVLEQECTADVSELRSQLGQLVPGYMVPAMWALVSEIPRIAGGKVDVSLMRQFIEEQNSAAEGEHAKPIGEISQGIVEVYQEILGTDQIHGASDFFLMGGTSLRAIRAFALLRERYVTRLPVSVMFQSPTPNALAALIEAERSDEQSENLFIVMREGKGDRTAYLLPGVGGHPLGFGSLLKQFSDDRRYIGVQLPGVDGSRKMFENMHDLASHIIDQMDLNEKARSPDIIGYSFGGALAMEIAYQLQEKGYAPGQVLLLDSHLMRGLPRKLLLGRLIEHLRSLVRTDGQGGLGYLIEKIRGASNGKGEQPNRPVSMNPDIDLVTNHNRRMVMNHVPRGIYRGPVELIRASQPEWLRFHRDDGVNGWAKWAASSQIRVHDVGGRHLDLLEPESAQLVADQVLSSIR